MQTVRFWAAPAGFRNKKKRKRISFLIEIFRYVSIMVSPFEGSQGLADSTQVGGKKVCFVAVRAVLVFGGAAVACGSGGSAFAGATASADSLQQWQQSCSGAGRVWWMG